MLSVMVCSPQQHEAMKADSSVWKSLKYIGVQNFDGKPVLILRNCECGSTLAKRCDCDAPDKVEDGAAK